MVDPVTGTIQTAAPLDRETEATYTLNVMATDQALDPDDRKSTTAVVSILLQLFSEVYIVLIKKKSSCIS